jgi:hypothetical protein
MALEGEGCNAEQHKAIVPVKQHYVEDEQQSDPPKLQILNTKMIKVKFNLEQAMKAYR